MKPAPLSAAATDEVVVLNVFDEVFAKGTMAAELGIDGDVATVVWLAEMAVVLAVETPERLVLCRGLECH